MRVVPAMVLFSYLVSYLIYRYFEVGIITSDNKDAYINYDLSHVLPYSSSFNYNKKFQFPLEARDRKLLTFITGKCIDFC